MSQADLGGRTATFEFDQDGSAKEVLRNTNQVIKNLADKSTTKTKGRFSILFETLNGSISEYRSNFYSRNLETFTPKLFITNESSKSDDVTNNISSSEKLKKKVRGIGAEAKRAAQESKSTSKNSKNNSKSKNDEGRKR